MPRSGCSALHGVNPNLKKKMDFKINEIYQFQEIAFFYMQIWDTVFILNKPVVTISDMGAFIDV